MGGAPTISVPPYYNKWRGIPPPSLRSYTYVYFTVTEIRRYAKYRWYWEEWAVTTMVVRIDYYCGVLLLILVESCHQLECFYIKPNALVSSIFGVKAKSQQRS